MLIYTSSQEAGETARPTKILAPGEEIRNQLEGKVVSVTLVKIGKSQVESVITRVSAEELALKKGDTVKVAIKSTEVRLQKD